LFSGQCIVTYLSRHDVFFTELALAPHGHGLVLRLGKALPFGLGLGLELQVSLR
jgi:hypothetical protein